MLVIDGYMGKSRKLEEILKEKNTNNENTIILDTVGIPSLINYGQCYEVPSVFEVSQFLYDYIQMDEPFGIKVDKNKIQYFVLEVNATRDMINTFKIMENRTGKKLIVTIQCPAIEANNGIRVYEVN